MSPAVDRMCNYGSAFVCCWHSNWMSKTALKSPPNCTLWSFNRGPTPSIFTILLIPTQKRSFHAFLFDECSLRNSLFLASFWTKLFSLFLHTKVWKNATKTSLFYICLYLLKQTRNKSGKLSNFLICGIVKPKRERRLKTFFPFLIRTRSCLVIPTNLNTKLGSSTMISTNQVDWGGLFVYSVSNWQWGAFGWSFVSFVVSLYFCIEGNVCYRVLGKACG